MFQGEKRKGNPIAEILFSIQLENNLMTLLFESTFGSKEADKVLDDVNNNKNHDGFANHNPDSSGAHMDTSQQDRTPAQYESVDYHYDSLTHKIEFATDTTASAHLENMTANIAIQLVTPKLHDLYGSTRATCLWRTLLLFRLCKLNLCLSA